MHTLPPALTLADADPFDPESAAYPVEHAGLHYDGSYVENHCPECGDYDSECVCSDEASTPPPSQERTTVEGLVTSMLEDPDLDHVGTALRFLMERDREHLRDMSSLHADLRDERAKREKLETDLHNRGVEHAALLERIDAAEAEIREVRAENVNLRERLQTRLSELDMVVDSHERTFRAMKAPMEPMSLPRAAGW